MSDVDTLSTSENGSGSALTTCPQCGQPLRPGELACGVCGYLIPTASTDSATRTLPHATESLESRRAPIGNIPHHFQRVTFVINGRTLVLPASPQLIIGRSDPIATSHNPDVD